MMGIGEAKSGGAMSIASSSVEFAENWEQVRDEWIADLDALFRQIEAWADAQGWTTRRLPVMMEADPQGPYPASRLLVRAAGGKLEFKPIARYVTAATGLIDLRAIPSRDATRMMARQDDGRWLIHPFGDTGISTPWTQAGFLETALAMFASVS
jgi:hypothetical protein